MTVVPLAFQLASWIPALWRGTAGGDDLVDLVGPGLLGRLTQLRPGTTAVTAYCPELGVGGLPGPKPTTEAAVAAGEAVILHGAPGRPASLLLPQGSAWVLLAADPARPLDLDLRQADSDLAQAVVAAERELRDRSASFHVPVRPAEVRPLPPDASSERRGLLVRAVRLWTAVAAVPAEARSPALNQVLHTAARASLAAYATTDRVTVDTAERARRPA